MRFDTFYKKRITKSYLFEFDKNNTLHSVYVDCKKVRELAKLL